MGSKNVFNPQVYTLWEKLFPIVNCCVLPLFLIQETHLGNLLKPPNTFLICRLLSALVFLIILQQGLLAVVKKLLSRNVRVVKRVTRATRKYLIVTSLYFPSRRQSPCSNLHFWRFLSVCVFLFIFACLSYSMCPCVCLNVLR